MGLRAIKDYAHMAWIYGVSDMPGSTTVEAKENNRRAVNVTLPGSLLQAARVLKINVSQACERGLVAEVAKVKTEQWLRDNRAAMDAWNAHVEEHGLPLAQYRQF